ncbi:MAG: hypothetical protein WDN30_08735 [Pararobbsia sp.]
MAVNLQRFIWGENETLEEAMAKQGSPMQLYMRSARSLDKWRNVLRGRSNVRAKLRLVSLRLAKRAGIALANLAHDVAKVEFGMTGRVQALAVQLERKGVEVRLVYGTFNRGLEELHTYFGRSGSRLRRYDHIRVEALPKLDHSLLAHTARERVFEQAEQYFAGFDDGAPPPRREAPGGRPHDDPAGFALAARAGVERG